MATSGSRDYSRLYALAGSGIFVIALGLLTRGLLMPIPAGVVEAVGGHGSTFWISKATHVLSYAFLAWIAVRLPCAAHWRIALVCLLIVHGCGTEYLQQFVGRHASVRDALLDVLGIGLGSCVGWRRTRDRHHDRASAGTRKE